ncbi:helix-turn-helix transcriptional regulator [Streptomyces sp. NPDC059567]|uniref:helix-turn-helix domain-containing protein n=1 Tax=Streptomyces sp. NPDC059567 TaxID=3346867 RepID=UPI00369F046B
MHRHGQYCNPARPTEADEERSGRVNPVTAALYRLDLLTDREREVLSAMPGGESNTDLAVRLGITERTVKFHVTNMREKLGGLSRLQLHLLALLAEIVWPGRLCRPSGAGRATQSTTVIARGLLLRRTPEVRTCP